MALSTREILIFKEAIEKEDRCFKLYTNFRYNFKDKALTGKFYSKYEQIDLTKVNNELYEKLKDSLDRGWKEKIPWPITANQYYGWFTQTLLPLFKQDDRFYHGRSINEFVKQEILIKSYKSKL